MVCYCCVKGCSNNSNIKKKDPGAAVSFHAFPSNPEQRSKWLRAIGRPNWNPPSHIRICSTHFSADQICLDGIRTRILEHAYPVQELPPNSNFEASTLEACRICLATDIKLHSLLSGLLKTCINFFDTGRNVDGLPQFVCYECAAHLMKFYSLVQKSLISQATLLEVFARHGQVNESLVRKLNRKELNLESSLSNRSLTSKVYEYKYDDVNNSSCLFSTKLSSNCCNEKFFPQERKTKNKVLLEHNLHKTETEVKMYEEESSCIKHTELENQLKNDYGNDEESGELLIVVSEDITDDYDTNYGDIFVEEQYAVTEESDTDDKCVHKAKRKSQRTGSYMQEYFTKEKLSESEEKPEFNCEQCALNFTSEAEKRVHVMTSFQHRKKPDSCNPAPRASLRECKTCGEQFSSRREFYRHCQSQHPRKRTSWSLPEDSYPTKCEHCAAPVRSRREHWRHVRRLHPSLRHLYRRVVSAVCAACGKGFQNTTKLRLHELRHRSPTIRCELCPKLFYDKYLLALHLATHSDARPHVCRVCGRAFKLKGNRDRHYRVHTDVASYECHLCSKKFKYSTSLNLHVRSVHYKIPPPPRKKRRNRNAVSQDI